MERFLVEKEKKIPVRYEPDVAVAGGGIAGITAAIAAARCGADVLLIEKQCMVGGLATSGLITGYLPLCDGNGNQVSFGLAEELLHLSIKYDAQSGIPSAWADKKGSIEARKRQRYQTDFNAACLALLAEELLVKEGVHILYDTKICAVGCEQERIRELVIENKSGRQAVRAKTYVDATGDADLFHYAGAATRLFGKGNILAGWYYYFNGQQVKLRPLGFAEVFDEERKDSVKPLIDRRFSGLDGQEISELLLASHEATRKDLLERKEREGRAELTAITGMPQLRMTRCMEGEYELRETQNGVPFFDSIGMIADWRKHGMVYEIPYRCLYHRKLRNVISAGRCICVDDGMWDISRVIPACAVTGEAAGTAAAMTSDITQLPIQELTMRLREQGQKLHLSEVYKDE